PSICSLSPRLRGERGGVRGRLRFPLKLPLTRRAQARGDLSPQAVRKRGEVTVLHRFAPITATH
ncbi:MAG TPA: hypothetical protein VGF60_00860, partial [Xanthobacteraceae bacterium]